MGSRPIAPCADKRCCVKYQLAQLVIARFESSQDRPNNADFVDSLDSANAITEAQSGFIGRFTGEGNRELYAPHGGDSIESSFDECA
ncbi:MAG: DUF3291 domain-containing protein [Woeseiaceae bacterium]